MEFTVACPIDGQIEVSLEDVDNVVLRDSERADITFVCPHCGTEITVSAIVPAFLMAAIEALADETDSTSASNVIAYSEDFSIASEEFLGDQEFGLDIESNDPRLDAYCEYFRRQLGDVDSAQDALDEIDACS
jgi:hypothetical protein